MTWTLTSYAAEHRDAVANLQQLLWMGGPSGNASYLHWKYFRNPYVRTPYIVLAWDRGRLDGMIGAFGAAWEIPGAGREMLPCLSDTVVVPERRGTPLFRLMLDSLVERLAVDGVPWLLDFGDQPAGPAMLMRGWKAIGPWAIAQTDGRTTQRAANDPDGTAPAVSGPRSGRLIAQPSSIDLDAVARLIAQSEDSTRVRHVRDVEYLKWRLENPLAHYYYFTAFDQEMVGYLLAHRTRVDAVDGMTPTTIMDCEAVADDVWADLVAMALAALPGRDIVMWIRDLSPARIEITTELGMSIRQPTGRITLDAELPNLIIRQTGSAIRHAAIGRLDARSLWDLRSVCGRSWR